MSRPTHDAVATIGKYTAADGTEKKRYQNVGKLFTDSDGRISLKLDVVPCGPGWNGWLSFYPVKDRSEGHHDKPAPSTSAEPVHDDGDDDNVPY